VGEKEEKRARFTLEARFLKRKDKVLAEFPMARIEATGVTNVRSVMGLYLVLRQVIDAFARDPNDRQAYQKGMAALSQLPNLLRYYVTDREKHPHLIPPPPKGPVCGMSRDEGFTFDRGQMRDMKPDSVRELAAFHREEVEGFSAYESWPSERKAEILAQITEWEREFGSA